MLEGAELRLRTIQRRLEEFYRSIWFFPILMSIGAIVLFLATSELDRTADVDRFRGSFFDPLIFTGRFRVIVVGAFAYVALIFLLRVSGKRTLSKMNAFDFVVTVALGSTLANVLLSKDIVLAEGIIVFAVLIFLQYVITWLSIRIPPVRRFIKAEPSLLYYRGEFLRTALRRRRGPTGSPTTRDCLARRR